MCIVQLCSAHYRCYTDYTNGSITVKFTNKKNVTLRCELNQNSKAYHSNIITYHMTIYNWYRYFCSQRLNDVYLVILVYILYVKMQ